MLVDEEQAYRAVLAKDARFDGHFILAVRTTGIYCRPSCPAITPKRRNVAFYPTSAAAQSAGFRACRRCLPDAVPGSPEWNLRADLAARAMRLISDGVVERAGVAGLAAQLGYSVRQLNRVLTAELGAGPLALARAHRAHAARILIELSDLSFSDIAFAAGFASIRQFNDTVRAVFASTPGELRAGGGRRSGPAASGGGRITLRLPVRTPFDGAGVLDFLGRRAIPGVESISEGSYGRTLRLPHGPATAWLTPDDGHVRCVLRLTEVRDLASAVSRLRRLLDLDADPQAVDEALGADPALAESVRAVPGIRVPGAVDGDELVVRALLGQQISAPAARTAGGRLCAELGSPLADPDGELTTLFPTAADIAAGGAEVLRGPQRRINAIVGVCAALADGSVATHFGREPAELRAELLALPGIGPWTADYVLMRVLGAPDVLLSTDLMVRRGAGLLGLPDTQGGLDARGEPWRPWRSYAGMHLWRATA
ncbi:DNA-3-methyladenine glycosylase II [Tamaricihabitans halophyticus]|uniref:DNA-3-methyladenine glycosylase II n=1 Tax=Tamaricihabitans halophyticus TaxID=1262583 RepID=A0A4R2R0U3_9PSEU|nr:DNA-3-methyladenine glycosylase 2 [Tamaricihabitans halophyticus]TCP56272.1 DNA-3-methyladenine glycosylase II [Tamaricihabitans halophyticus]